MIEPIPWRLVADERAPFERGGRHLRVTIYCPNTSELSSDETFGLGLIRELAAHESLRVADTDPNALWHLEVDIRPNEHGVASVDLVGPDDQRVFMSMRPPDWIDQAIRLLGVGSSSDDKTRELAAHLPYVEAHCQTHRDLFVTTQPDLLRLRGRMPNTYIKDVFEGLTIIGLYLRSVEDFTIRVWDRGRNTFDRALFYWVLCRERLPDMWRYFSACLRRSQALQDQTGYLANTILDRCVRVLQARDEVGFKFYQRQNNSTRDEMLYHFDYLTLMLSGALDAQARIARRACGVTSVAERSTSFRNQQFRQGLETAGDRTLIGVVNAPDFLHFQRLLGVLRNTVHCIGLRGVGVSRSGEPEASVVRVFEDAQTVWDISHSLGSRDDFGVTSTGGDVTIEPFTCAVRLTEVGLRHVNEIARATDVGRLLPAGVGVSDLVSGPPDDNVFGRDNRRRIGALG